MKPVAHFTHQFHPKDRVSEIRRINVKLYTLERELRDLNLAIQIEVKLYEIAGTEPATQVVKYDTTQED